VTWPFVPTNDFPEVLLNRHFTRIAIAFLLLALSGSLVAGIHRAVTPPANATAEAADALGIGSISGASVRGVVASVQGTLITLNSGGAPAIVIDSSAAKFVTAKDGAGSIGDVKPGVRITAFINTAPTLQPSSFLRAQLITIESQPDLEVTGTIDSIDLTRSRFTVLGSASASTPIRDSAAPSRPLPPSKASPTSPPVKSCT